MLESLKRQNGAQSAQISKLQAELIEAKKVGFLQNTQSGHQTSWALKKIAFKF